MSQETLAERAGMTQSVVSAYERGRREPSLPMLRRLVEAAGCRLTVSVESESLLERVRRRRDELLTVLGALGATDVRVFGSAARGDETSTSDIDLVVHLAEDTSLFTLGRMQAEAERILGIPADIVPDSGLRPDVRASVEREGVPL